MIRVSYPSGILRDWEKLNRESNRFPLRLLFFYVSQCRDMSELLFFPFFRFTLKDTVSIHARWISIFIERGRFFDGGDAKPGCERACLKDSVQGIPYIAEVGEYPDLAADVTDLLVSYNYTYPYYTTNVERAPWQIQNDL